MNPFWQVLPQGLMKLFVFLSLLFSWNSFFFSFIFVFYSWVLAYLYSLYFINSYLDISLFTWSWWVILFIYSLYINSPAWALTSLIHILNILSLIPHPKSPNLRDMIFNAFNYFPFLSRKFLTPPTLPEM